MCGIAGLVGFGPDGRQNIERMKARMAHRGPDADGTWVSEDGSVVLGHQRLAIRDLSAAGAQPFVSASGRSVIVYNGEIYNGDEVKRALADAGWRGSFCSTCDTEVLIEACEWLGVERTLKLCRGMFAFGLFDLEHGTLTLARDRAGEKPLYYGCVTNPEGKAAFAFASDLGSIAAIEGFSAPVDRGVLDIYFEHGYIPAPYSIYEGIRKLVPGTILTVKLGAQGSAAGNPETAEEWERRSSVKTYWSMRETALCGREHPFEGSFSEASQELERRLREAIRGQSEADVPLGAFLSAGIDSSTIVALMQTQSERPVRTFTIGMEDPAYNEADAAARIARHLGTEHTELKISEKDAKSVIPLLPKMFAEPFADSSQIPTYLVSRLTRQYVTVSLSGDAGDELFCGYTTYASAERVWRRCQRIPRLLRRAGGSIVLHSPLRRFPALAVESRLLAADCPEDIYRLSFRTDERTAGIALEHPGYPYAYTVTGRDELGEVNRDIMLMDAEMYLPDDILAKVDRTSMAVSLESRVPMLDRDVCEFAWALSIGYLRAEHPSRADGTVDARGNRLGKLVLRDILYRYVPRELADQPKKGFAVPLARWLREPELRQWAEALLSPERIRREGYLDAEVVSSLWNEYTEGGVWRAQIWYILMFEAWLESVRQ
ncbi:MAG: asparagine synthase (glutamine-hydrolyzing) [Lachnospiraceae bacterium]|nr:asparagine synthase (glutamine-hydrolyzing) [Lachnospiraceae bacterium]